MKILNFQLKLCAFAGMYVPVSWSRPKRTFYYFYAASAGFLHVLGISLQVLLLVLDKDLKEVFDVMFFLLVSILITVQYSTLHFNRRSIARFRDILVSEEFTPKNQTERDIDNFYSKYYRLYSIAGIILTTSAASLMLATPFFGTKNYFEYLPMKIWSPIAINRNNYWSFYFLQVFTIFLGAYATTISTLLFCGVIIEACSQLDILADRFRRIPELVTLKCSNISLDSRKNLDKALVIEYIRHHNEIYQLTKILNDMFFAVIAFEFLIPLLVTAFTVYKLSEGIKSVMETVMLIIYALAIIYELFAYCVFSHFLTTKSEEFAFAIYNMDLELLMNEHFKSLLFVMQRSSNPIVMNAGSLMLLTLDSFVKIMKTSYTALRMLNTTNGQK